MVRTTYDRNTRSSHVFHGVRALKDVYAASREDQMSRRWIDPAVRKPISFGTAEGRRHMGSRRMRDSGLIKGW